MTTTFWLLAAVIGIGMMLAILLPSLKTRQGKRPVTVILAMVIGVLLVGFIIYGQVGTPTAIDQPVTHAAKATDAPQSMQAAVSRLEARLQAEPDNVDGWLLLGRSYKMVQRYTDAENALVNAMTLAPENPGIMVELAEAMTMASGDPRFSDRAIELLQTAIDTDPTLQKALWLRGMAATQRGKNDIAVANWEQLLVQIDPASDVAGTVRKQIAEAQGRELVEPKIINIPINVSLAPDMDSQLPESAVLYIFARPLGGVGMPLAVKRISRPAFPVMVSLSEHDVLQPGTSLDGKLQISARLSMSGNATPGAGDFRADNSYFETLPDAPIELELNTVITP